MMRLVACDEFWTHKMWTVKQLTVEKNNFTHLW